MTDGGQSSIQMDNYPINAVTDKNVHSIVPRFVYYNNPCQGSDLIADIQAIENPQTKACAFRGLNLASQRGRLRSLRGSLLYLSNRWLWASQERSMSSSRQCYVTTVAFVYLVFLPKILPCFCVDGEIVR